MCKLTLPPNRVDGLQGAQFVDTYGTDAQPEWYSRIPALGYDYYDTELNPVRILIETEQTGGLLITTYSQYSFDSGSSIGVTFFYV